MPSKSPAQARMMAMAAHDPAMAKRVGVPQKVAREFNRADTGGALLSRANKRSATRTHGLDSIRRYAEGGPVQSFRFGGRPRAGPLVAPAPVAVPLGGGAVAPTGGRYVQPAGQLPAAGAAAPMVAAPPGALTLGPAVNIGRAGQARARQRDFSSRFGFRKGGPVQSSLRMSPPHKATVPTKPKAAEAPVNIHGMPIHQPMSMHTKRMMRG